MQTNKITFFIVILLFVFSHHANSQCNTGDQTGGQGGGGGKAGDDGDGIDWVVRRVHSADPNDILGPVGYLEKRWVAAKDRMGYRIRFENNHEVATAPAQNIFIRQPIDSSININSLRLGSFGFGYFTFEVPPNTSLYTTRLDVKDSLGIHVDVIAGIDIIKHEIFWSFKSIDPVTGRTPENALIGILLVNDSSINRFNDTLPNRGEGFVTYEINAKNATTTGDTASAQAIIVFDTNEEIPTNTWVNSFDAFAPISKALSAAAQSDTIIVNWSGHDDAGGSGIKSYALYVSENGGTFTLLKNNITDQFTAFAGTPGTIYGFFTLAIDQVGNTEPLKTTAEVTIQLGNCSEEICNGVDDDCDGLVDEGFTATYYPDTDGDGFGATTGSITATECNHSAGFVLNNSDCNDTKAAVHPGATEICDGLDNDCDGQTDEDVQPATWYRDADGDGFGNPADSTQGCTQPQGYVSSNTDCNDGNNAIYPGAPELCDGIDNNCNGQVDEGIGTHTWYQDNDGDGYGSAVTVTNCNTVPPLGYVNTPGDCNDSNAAVHPGATETCNGTDDNCNGQIDEGCTVSTWYRDADSDGYGRADSTITAALQPAGYVLQSGDCNDNNAAVHPGVAELCNSIDDNCNGVIDEGCSIRTWYRDVDGDGYGRNNNTRRSIAQPPGYTLFGGDCNDNNPAIHPGANELANGIDDNCSGEEDEGFPKRTWYRDVDGDGYGRSNNSRISTFALPGYVLQGGDCNDNNSAINPGMSELLDGIDNNCNNNVDEGFPKRTWYRDVDGDGYGRTAGSRISTLPILGYVLLDGDCNDNEPAIHPGAVELPNGMDDNCNNNVDEGLPRFTWYRDADSDGYGRNNNSRISTVQPTGYVLTNGDCNDNNPAIHPGAIEIANGRDDNCNHQVDEITTTVVTAKSTAKIGQQVVEFDIKVSPVPSSSSFTIYIQGSNHAEKIELRVVDRVGRLVEIKTNLFVGQTIELGSNYAKGFYIIEAVQGRRRKMVKVIKL